jgi:predicted glycoside hydrolase/deacetylase ChbG (UPF0249 family)
MRRLIINADDLGMAPCVNRAAEELFQGGYITSASLLVPAPYGEEAAVMAKSLGLPLGVHWTLHSEWADQPWPSLAVSAHNQAAPGDASHTQGGMLFPDERRLAKEAAGKDVYRELQAQLNRMGEWSCAADHADGHGTSLYGINGRFFFIAAFQICRRHGLPFRLPWGGAFLARQLGRKPPPALIAAHRAMALLARFMGTPLPQDMITDPRPAAAIGGYEQLRAFYLDALRHAGPGITELFLHPSLPEGDMLARSPAWRKRGWEYELLRSGDVTALARKQGFVLCSWGQILEDIHGNRPNIAHRH